MTEEKAYSSRERLLSPEELAECVTRQKEFNLPTIGSKLSTPTGSFLESKHIESRLQNLQTVTAFPRVSQRCQMSEASWDVEIHKAKVSKAIGRYWETLGHLVDSQLCLYPEEALFLMECNNLIVSFGDVAMSVQQAYEVMLGPECSLEEHLTFSMLARLGYKVVRHQGDLGITSYERQIKLDQYQRKRKSSKRENSRLEPSDVSATKQSKCDEDEKVSQIIDVNCTADADEEGFHVDEVFIPDPQFSKSDITVPRLKPSESISTSAILKKISLKNRQINSTKVKKIVEDERNISTKFKISFDVYLPSVRFRKSIPRLPNYRVVVCGSDSKVPNSADVRATLGSLKDGVPLLFAVCSISNTSFFCFSEVNLPTEITIG